MSGAAEPEGGHPEERVVPSFLGPLSVLGCALGVLVWILVLLEGGALAWLALVPAAGVGLLAVPGPVRELGTGLVASVLFWPVTVAGWGLLLLVLGLLGG